MVATATLLLLLAIAFQTTTAFAARHDPPETFPNGQHDAKSRPTIPIPDPQADLKTIQESCPPLGHHDERFKVTVLGTLSPAVGGCASSMKYRHDIVPGFNLWLGDAKTGGGSCDEEGLDHYSFECFSKHPLIEDDTIKAWYVTLYDKTARWSGRKDYKCGLYSMLNDDPPLIQMIISANRSCDGLSQRMSSVDHRVPQGFRHFEDGSVGLLFSKDWAQPISGSDVWRKKRSPVTPDSVHRFPDWSQGSWLDLQVDGGLLSYDTAYQEKDDVDYDQDNENEKDRDAEISSGEQYMQKSRRNVPVGASSRNRRSIPNINGIKMFRTRSSTIQNNKENKDWLKHQLFNENMRISDAFHFRRERRQIVPEKQKYFFDIFTQILPQESVENSSDLLGFGEYATKIAQPNKTTNVNHHFSKVLLDNNYRKKRDLENEGTKQRKKRCSGSSETETTTARHGNWDFEHPPKDGDPMDPIYKDIRLLPQKRDVNHNTRRGQTFFENIYNALINSPFIRDLTDLINERDLTSNGESTSKRKKREVQDRYSWENEGTKQRKKRCSGSSETETTTARHGNWDFEHPPKDGDPMDPIYKDIRLLPQKRDVNHNTRRGQTFFENIYNALINSPFIRDLTDLINERDLTSNGESTSKRKKREVQDRYSWENEGTKQRKKRCSGSSETETTTARHGNWDFEHPPKDGDPMDPIYKDIRLLPQKRDVNHNTRRGQTFFENIYNALINSPFIRDLTDLINERDLTSNGESTSKRKKREVQDRYSWENEGTKQRKKRCSGSSETETTTARHGNWDFEHPPKDGDPMDPIYKDIRLLPQKRDVKQNLDRGKTFYKEIFKSLLNISFIRDLKDLINERDLTSNGESTSKRKKREVHEKYSWEKPTTTTTEHITNLWTENPLIPIDLMEPFFWTTKEVETTPDYDYDSENYRKRRSTDEALVEKSKSRNYEEEAALKKIKVIEEVSKLIRWGNVIRALPYISHRRHDQSNRDIKENEYELFPNTSMPSVPSPAKYLEFAKIFGIPYKEAVLKWRSLERKHRQQEAEADYAVYPGQNHPDIVMRDFDQTFDGIEYDFNPLYPEGTDEDPTAYRALTLPGGYRLEPRLSRRTTFEGKQLGAALEPTTTDSNFKYIQPNSINDQKYTLKTNKRMRRSSTQHNQQQHETTKFTWRCIMPVNNDEKQHQNLEAGAKFLTYGGRIEKSIENGNDQHNEQKSDLNIDDSKMSYGCLWLVPRGPNIIEFSIIGTGLPDIHQDIESFARQLCTEKKAVTINSNMKNKKKFHIRRRPSWVTETRADEAKRVPVGCPVSSGIVFYGEVPAPPPSSTIINNSQPAPPRLCVKLISSADDCTNGKAGPIDQMKYTKSECVEQDTSTAISPQTVAGQQTIFEESRGYTAGESWRRNKRHSAHTDTSPVASSVIGTSTSTDTLMLSGQGASSGEIDNISSHQTTESTATSSTATNSYSTTPSRSNDSKSFVDITFTDPTTLNMTTTTATTFSTVTSSTLPLSLSQQTTSPERQLPSFSPSTISTTFTTTPPPFTSTETVTTTTSYYPVTDHHYRQQQQWQQQHQQTNYNNTDYYYRGRQQQHYPPPPLGSTGTDYNNYYLQRQHQQPQAPSYWLPQQQVNGANDYSNGYQQRTTDGGGRRTDDYYYRQQQQNYYNHQYNNDRQHQTPQPRNSSLAVQHPSGGDWNVHGDRPLYISSGNNREASVAWNSSAGISDSNNGGWATPEQQHWWYQQQQQRQQEQQMQYQQQRQQEQQRQYQQRQQQNNRGLSGILSLPPVPLPPLHVEQGTVTVSAVPTSPPLHLRRPQKPPNHYYLPTLTTKTTTDHPYRLRSKSESRYYEEREYKCLGQWTEPQQHISPEIEAKPIMLTYMYVKRLNPAVNGTDQYECFVGTLIPNDPGVNSETTTTLLLTEAGSGTLCSRRADPYRTGMKLVGTKINKEGACNILEQPAQDTAGGSWYPLKPQPISPSIPGAENSGGTWYAAPPVPVAAKSPTTMMPILTGRHTGGHGSSFKSRQNERHPHSEIPPKTNNSIRTTADEQIIILFAVILFCGHLNYITQRYLN